MKTRHVRVPFLVLLMVVVAAVGSPEVVAAETSTRVLDDGTTLIDVVSPTGVPVREEVILPHGRHKITYFDHAGRPLYASVDTGGGAFGLMYYISGREAPVFKFWDYGRGAGETGALDRGAAEMPADGGGHGEADAGETHAGETDAARKDIAEHDRDETGVAVPPTEPTRRRPGQLVIQVYRADFLVDRELEIDPSDGSVRSLGAPARSTSPVSVWAIVGTGLLTGLIGAFVGYRWGSLRRVSA